ncbi:MAG: STAS domain-containing protein [Lachnospiraceae bacterium]|nr:STAS domain-containing protein [Lachnospiraceae bacterium]
MTIQETVNGDTIQLAVEGSVDINTAPELQAKILSCFQQAKHVILDFGGVNYLSSAGLRALMLGQKTAMSKNGTMKMMNVQAPIMQVLSMTGFSGILTFI